MPSLAPTPAVKSDRTAGIDVPESFKSVVTVVEKKCRNLEKRKVSLILKNYCPSRYRVELAWATRGRHAGSARSWFQIIENLFSIVSLLTTL